jgi:hypothetical protein
MSTFLTRVTVLFTALCLGSLCAQTQQISLVTSSYPLTATSIGATKFYSVSMTVSYPAGLTPSSYISGTQLNTDFQTFNSAYVNQQDPR